MNIVADAEKPTHKKISEYVSRYHTILVIIHQCNGSQFAFVALD